MRALRVLGVLAVLALPALTTGFALRLADGYGVTYEPLDVSTYATPSGERVLFRVNAFQPDRDQELEAHDVAGVLVLADGTELDVPGLVPRGCALPRCATTVALALPAGTPPPDGAWTLTVRVTWTSVVVGTPATHHATFRGEGMRFE